MHVLIVGGGIAGLTLTVLLRQRGIDSLVLDKRNVVDPVGYALGLWPLGGRVLRALGLDQKLSDVSVPLRRYCIADSRGRLIHMHPVGLLGETFGWIRMVQRRALVRILASAAGNVVRLGMTIERISQSERDVNVVFSDGSSERFDLLVGCDGIHSRVRTLLFEGVGPQSTGWTGWGWWVDPALARSDTMTEYWDPGKWFCAIYPAKDLLCAVFGSPIDAQGSERSRDKRELVQERLGAMENIVPGLKESMRIDQEIFSDTFYSLRLSTWVKGRVVLLGDACSAYFPFGGLGLGASMAMEGAAVLADELSDAKGSTVADALQAYETRRRTRVEAFENAARATEEIVLRPKESVRGTAAIVSHQRMMFRQFKEMVDRPI